MQALASYSPQEISSIIQPAIMQWQDPLEGLVAGCCMSERGNYVKFLWADWPEDLSARLGDKVEVFLRQHHELRLVEKGSEDWRAIITGETDAVAAAEIGRRLLTHFPAGKPWVMAEGDRRGRVIANSFTDGIGEIRWELSWRHVSAAPAVLRLNGQDVQRLNEAILDISRWAGSRVRPILDALHDRLKALYGERLRGLYVYGSYARPDAGIELPESSDLDVALILSDFESPYAEIERFSPITSDLSLEHGLVISLVPIRDADFREGTTNFIRVISEYAIRVP